MDKSHCAYETKDGTHRFCVDYQELNSMTRADTFPLPWIDDYWTSSGSQCISQPSTLLLGIGRSACTSYHRKRQPLWYQRGCMSLSHSFWTHCHLLATHGVCSDGAQPWRRTRFHYSIYWQYSSLLQYSRGTNRSLVLVSSIWAPSGSWFEV